ncbi:MAG: precorrin-6A/cobalt-precorrin-6A reductase, partial [Propionibacteriaceae bacterium]|nr:precorrin-6A/cobalt-precorrin-6A reductase [Propionibacteriaceae bacterium]
MTPASKRVDIVGTGLGPATLTREAAEAITGADLVVGSARLLAEHAEQAAVCPASRPDEMVAAIQRADACRIAVLMSGDVGFHSGAGKVFAALREDDSFEVQLLAGVSTPALFAARLGVSWGDAGLVSCHGQDSGIVAQVRRHRRTFVLTGRNVAGLAASLSAAGYGALSVYAGQDLGYPSTHLVAMRGPVGRELNAARFRQYAAKILGSKESGEPGGCAD